MIIRMQKYVRLYSSDKFISELKKKKYIKNVCLTVLNIVK